MRRYWIGKLQQVLNATDFRFGSYSNLDDQTIADARNVVIDWVRQLAVSLEHDCVRQVAVSFEHDCRPQLSFLTHAMVTANIAFTFDRNEASAYLYRSMFIHSVECPERYFQRLHHDGEHCLQKLFVALHGNGPLSIVNGIFFIRSVTELCIIFQS